MTDVLLIILSIIAIPLLILLIYSLIVYGPEIFEDIFGNSNGSGFLGG